MDLWSLHALMLKSRRFEEMEERTLPNVERIRTAAITLLEGRWASK